jgi:thioesterase domain-containing protein/acyl carrier protein
VFDVFGMMACGGALVVPPADSVSPPNPMLWLKLVEEQQITVWNTVPAFVELLVKFSEYAGRRLPACLRVIFMSGDWIPLNLPGRARALSDNPDLRIISMGGATEAAIWSNTHEIGEELLPGWASIPYGVPMRNQTMYILDENLDHCEPWVTGVIFIGGHGTALGYKDLERTKKQFFHHPTTGEWLFRTGDLGRLRPDGHLEILGREDTQVKVNGFRVELGEIDRIIEEHVGVASAVTVVYQNALVAYVELREGGALAEDDAAAALRALCAVRMPQYMVPRSLVVLEALPLSANGKVQRDKLPPPQMDGGGGGGGSGGGGAEEGDAPAGDAPADSVEERVLALFATTLRLAPAAVPLGRSFFNLGGDSLSALRLLIAVHEQLGVELTIPDLFEGPTVVQIAALLRAAGVEGEGPGGGAAELGDGGGGGGGGSGAAASPVQPPRAPVPAALPHIQLLTIREGDPTQLAPMFLVHPAGASGLCYRALADTLDAARPLYALDDTSLNALAMLALTKGPKGGAGAATSAADWERVFGAGFRYPYGSIEEVAAACVPLIRGVLDAIQAKQAKATKDQRFSRERTASSSSITGGGSGGGGGAGGAGGGDRFSTWTAGDRRAARLDPVPKRGGGGSRRGSITPVRAIVGGWSYGGVVSMAVAEQLEALGVQVDMAVLFDPPLTVVDGGGGGDGDGGGGRGGAGAGAGALGDSTRVRKTSAADEEWGRLRDIARAVRATDGSGVEVKTRRYRLTRYPDCFVGGSLVDWLLAHDHARTRAEGVDVGRQLLAAKVIHHVCDDHNFKDEQLFYEFVRGADGRYGLPAPALGRAEGGERFVGWRQLSVDKSEAEKEGAARLASALRQDAQQPMDAEVLDTVRRLTQETVSAGGGGGSDAAANAAVVEASVEHFRQCTKLLRAHTCAVSLRAPVHDFRPLEDDGKVPRAPLEHLTSGGVTRHSTPGSHWTMLFDENVDMLGEKLSRVLLEAEHAAGGGVGDGGGGGGVGGDVFGGGEGRAGRLSDSLLGSAVNENYFIRRSASVPAASSATLRALRRSLDPTEPDGIPTLGPS